MDRRSKSLFLLALVLVTAGTLLFPACPVDAALRPDQLLLIVNKRAPESVRIAQYYMEKRGVPLQNAVLVETSREEEMGRKEYEDEIAVPVRRFLTRYDPGGTRFQCLVLVYGIPLRIDSAHADVLDKARIVELEMRISILKGEGAAKEPKQKQEFDETIRRLEREITEMGKKRQGASVDSEIALVMEKKYPLEGWLPNRYFVGFRGKNLAGMPKKVRAVCRLDGPTEAIVYRIIDDSLFAEQHGLAGKAYFDARWPGKESNALSPYEVYDRAIHNTARIVEKSGRLPVVLDEREALFEPGTAPDAALYLGWYSLRKYVDAFTWARGAVGFHVASAECTTLKTPTSTVWCKAMLEKGVAATLGPVSEPYLPSFPAPEVFFGCLLSGGTLVECYTVSNPFWSWQMVLIGDPLYRPFKQLLEK